MRLLTMLRRVALAALIPASVLASGYPAKPVKIIVPYPAGQGTDIATRYLAEQLGRELGQPFVVENRPGAGGNLGVEQAGRSAGDGYTLVMGTNATHVLNEYLYPKLPFDPEKDFAPIALIGTFPMVLAVNAASPFHSSADVVAAAQRGGRTADIALPSTSARLVVELLKERSGAPLFGVPYKGSGGAMTDVIGGQLPVIVDTPTSLRPHLAGGKVRAIAVTSRKQSSLVPGVKTVEEQGFAGFEVIAWNALYAPKGTPPAVTQALNAAVNKVLQRPDARQKLLELGFEPAGGTPAQLAEFVRSERRKWQPLILAAGIKLD